MHKDLGRGLWFSFESYLVHLQEERGGGIGAAHGLDLTGLCECMSVWGRGGDKSVLSKWVTYA
jgi:hypothetical protein